jgi:HK97 family phage major capsid protein/HK97 family phage prohead protease
MPIKPRKGEEKPAFMQRCMDELGQSDTERPQDQKVAICLNAWREAHGGNPPPKEFLLDPEWVEWFEQFQAKKDKPNGEYGDVAYADPGYQEDKKPRYPIDTEEHIRAAWSYINQERNAGQYSADELAHIKARIVAAWKDKIDPAGPPGAGKTFVANRAYSVLNIKRFDDDQRVIEGIASTPNTDRQGDIVESMGAKFALPFPLLWHHKSDSPVGEVEWAQPNESGIPFRARIAKIEEPGEVKTLCDKAWHAVKARLVKAVSIGFRSLKHEMLKQGRMRIKEYEILELSLVTIPANSEATIHAIRSLDETLLSHSDGGDGKRPPVAASATRKSTVKLQEAKMAKKSIAEQISGFEATRAAKMARMEEIMSDAADKGETLDDAQQNDYDDLAADVESVDKHLTRLRLLEKTQIAKAVEVNGKSVDEASKSRGTVRVEGVRSCVPKGILFARHFIAKTYSQFNHMSALEAARTLGFFDQTPELETILKAPVAVGTTTGTTWAAPLAEPQFMAQEFIDLLTPMTIIGRIPGLRRVPFNIKIPRATTAASVTWVGEGSAKPVSSMAFDSISLGHTKVAGIVPVTEELFRFSNPSIETLVRDSLLQAVAQLTDFDFLDPTKAAVTGVSPASITFGVTPHTASGTTADSLRTDLGALLSSYADANMSMAGLVLVMKPQRAIRISLMRTTLGTREFEGLTPNGGTLEGIPVVVSDNIYDSGSPAGDLIVAVNAPEVLLADDGQVSVDISREASLQMDSAPDSPPTASTVTVSLWQHNMVGIRAERSINYLKRRDTAVQYIEGANYA